MQSFSNRLIALRKERGLTQAELAKDTHLQRSTLSGYETEGKEPTYDTLCALAKYFDVTTDYLLGVSSVRTHNDAVFVNDTNEFASAYEQLPDPIKSTVAACFDSFYPLLLRDMELCRPERLRIYKDLFRVLQSLRRDISKAVEASGGAVTDPIVLSNLMALQSQLKNEVSALIDKLVQADIEIAFNLKSGVGSGFSKKSAG